MLSSSSASSMQSSSPRSYFFMSFAQKSNGFKEGFIHMVTFYTSIACVPQSIGLALDFIFVGGLLCNKEEMKKGAEECTPGCSNFFFLSPSPLPKMCDSTGKEIELIEIVCLELFKIFCMGPPLYSEQTAHQLPKQCHSQL